MESHRHALGLWLVTFLLSLPGEKKKGKKKTGHPSPRRPSLPAHLLPSGGLETRDSAHLHLFRGSDPITRAIGLERSSTLPAPREQAQGATQNGDGCVNLARHVLCSTVSQPSRTLFQHRVLTTMTASSGSSARPIGPQVDWVDVLLAVAIQVPDYCCSNRPSRLHKSLWKYIYCMDRAVVAGVPLPQSPAPCTDIYMHLHYCRHSAQPSLHLRLLPSTSFWPTRSGYRYSQLVVCAKHRGGLLSSSSPTASKF